MALSQEHLTRAFQARQVRFYEQIESTNDAALQWAVDGAPTGAFVVADEQTRGRGRFQRAWYAPPGTSLMTSVILRPTAEQASQVTMLGALAVCEVLNELGALHVGIKWPNDVRLGGQKVAGVLPEAVWQNDQLRAVVLGMGINVRVNFRQTEFRDTATSVETVLGRRIDRLDLLVRLVERVDYWTDWLGTDALFGAWRHWLVVLGKSVTVSGAHGSAAGVAEAVDATGALLLRTADGQTERFVAGGVTLRETADGD